MFKEVRHVHCVPNSFFTAVSSFISMPVYISVLQKFENFILRILNWQWLCYRKSISVQKRVSTSNDYFMHFFMISILCTLPMSFFFDKIWSFFSTQLMCISFVKSSLILCIVAKEHALFWLGLGFFFSGLVWFWITPWQCSGLVFGLHSGIILMNSITRSGIGVWTWVNHMQARTLPTILSLQTLAGILYWVGGCFVCIFTAELYNSFKVRSCFYLHIHRQYIIHGYS